MNESLFVLTTDWHLVVNDTAAGGTGETHPTDAGTVVDHITSLDPSGVIDLGDCKDGYQEDIGSDTQTQHANYIADVRDQMPWSEVVVGSAAHPILPGNHDEVHDYSDPGSSTDFSLFDSAFWPAPYHWVAEWEYPKIRFIAVHTHIHHSQDGFAGFGHIDTAELDWLQTQLDDLGAREKAIVCSHFPVSPTFGNQVRFVDNTSYTNSGPNPYKTLLAANADKIVAYLNGHRHQNFLLDTIDGIIHMSLPSMAYTAGNSLGGFVPITYDASARSLSFDYRLGPPSAYSRYAGFTPIELSLPVWQFANVRAA